MSWQSAVFERPVFGLTRVKQVAVKCPKCGAFTHPYYGGPELEKHRRQLREMEELVRRYGDLGRVQREYRVAKTRFKAEFDRYQQEIREKISVSSKEASK